jgi:hypothetical protein
MGKVRRGRPRWNWAACSLSTVAAVSLLAGCGHTAESPDADLDFAFSIPPSQPLTVHFVGQGDSGVGDLQWSWDFGDGSPPACCQDAEVTHAYEVKGLQHDLLGRLIIDR